MEWPVTLEDIVQQLEYRQLDTHGTKTDLFYRLKAPSFRHLKDRSEFQEATINEERVYAKQLYINTPLYVYYYPSRDNAWDPPVYFSTEVTWENDRKSL